MKIMPYKSNSELPESVRKSLPEHGQDIYREAYNSAWEQYDEPEERRGGRSREETAHAIAWSAVKKEYERVTQGKWVKKRRLT
jgi:cation transport regulator